MIAICFMLVSCLAYSSTVKMEESCSSETSFNFWWTSLHYNPESRTLQKISRMSRRGDDRGGGDDMMVTTWEGQTYTDKMLENEH
jgi:hypothetical protein